MLFFSKEKTRSRRYKLLTFVNIFLRNLLSFNLLILLFLNLLKELAIDSLDKNASKIKVVNKKTSLEVLKDASLFR